MVKNIDTRINAIDRGNLLLKYPDYVTQKQTIRLIDRLNYRGSPILNNTFLEEIHLQIDKSKYINNH